MDEPFVDRVAELAELGEQFALAAAGQGRVVMPPPTWPPIRAWYATWNPVGWPSGRPTPPHWPGSGRPPLSARQLLVARAAAAGKSNREIAAELYISVKTVEFHLGQILARLDLDSRTQIARALTSPDPPAPPAPGSHGGPPGPLAHSPGSVRGAHERPATAADRRAPSSQQASRSCLAGGPVTATGGRTARHCRPVVIDSTARTAPVISIPPCTYRP